MVKDIQLWCTRWFKYDRDCNQLVYTQISPGHIWTTLHNTTILLNQQLTARIGSLYIHLTSLLWMISITPKQISVFFLVNNVRYQYFNSTGLPYLPSTPLNFSGSLLWNVYDCWSPVIVQNVQISHAKWTMCNKLNWVHVFNWPIYNNDNNNNNGSCGDEDDNDNNKPHTRCKNNI